MEVYEIDMKAVNDFFKSLPAWNIENELGYKPITTFWQDFSIADAMARLGENPIPAIRLTFKCAVESWKDDYKYMTELVMVLNHKIFEHHARADKANREGRLNERDHELRLATEYNAAWMALDDWCRAHLKGEELEYYYETTD